jgi:sec-independent protein translocase protein TatA|tara:strand:- start:347 stop:520 length:174 start_codon:yes stop_codon:yes gene_type:complete
MPLGATELLIIFFIIILLFGAKKLPELAKGLGKGIKEFKNSSKDVSDALNAETENKD